MVEREIIESVRRDFEFLEGDVLGVLIFGSSVKGRGRDIDICVVAPEKDPKEILRKVWRNVDVSGKNYDVWVFEELPLYMKIEVIRNGIVIIGNEGDIYEYFYKYWKIWRDQERRQRMSKDELLKVLERSFYHF